ncbi:uncharacterized protein LOC119681678 [Teleopsis dalmanni]|uniref:uncharacterized protein LOC119681678 n=1 Tax=Teleopsis dalmanni TaxID=139649 RepID=UPI0018CE4E59|nr:uncharacterized protein LOC119681678 [Teleopsis dalmanni]
MRSLLILFFLTLASVEILAAKSAFSAAHTDISTNLLQGLPNSERLRFLETVWNKLREKSPFDVTKALILYRLLKVDFCNCRTIDPLELQAAQTLQQELLQEITNRCAHALAGVLNVEVPPDNSDFHNLLEFYVTDTQELPLLLNIIYTAIDKVYNWQPSDVLAIRLWRLNQFSDRISFSIRVQAQLYLYYKFNSRGDVNDDYLLIFGYNMQQIHNDPRQNQLEANLKRRLNNAKSSLPSALQYFYLKPNFCLYNKGRKEYIYTTEGMEIDGERRFIFNWVDPSYVDDHGKWRANLTDVPKPNGGVKLKVALLSIKFYMYMYLEKDLGNYMDVVAAWRTGSAPATSYWNVELVNNELIFSQDGKLMCASDRLYDKDRRYVKAFDHSAYSYSDQVCQWIAGECHAEDLEKTLTT